jgi:hypothetical protein
VKRSSFERESTQESLLHEVERLIPIARLVELERAVQAVPLLAQLQRITDDAAEALGSVKRMKGLEPSTFCMASVP